MGAVPAHAAGDAAPDLYCEAQEMAGRLILAGDVNLKNITDSTAPFRHVVAKLHSADVVFANLECRPHLPPHLSHANEGFFADPQLGR
jgi:hypothetical protein